MFLYRLYFYLDNGIHFLFHDRFPSQVGRVVWWTSLQKSKATTNKQRASSLQTGNKKHPENAGDTPNKTNEPASPGIEKPSRFLTISALNAFALLAFRS
jgi:hypothetical protein